MHTIGTRCILVDVENLLGCSPELASDAAWDLACEGLVEALRYRPETDRLTVASAPSWAFEARARFPRARLVVRRGSSGADRALCEEVDDAEWIASRFAEVIIASGDHEFIDSVVGLRAAGVRTTVAALPASASAELTARADDVVWLERPAVRLGESAYIRVSGGMRRGTPAARAAHALAA
ncbi:NYN domain-containing protein [Demequina salsinemoris]|uniref:NYN domain-containing protein n=1 Tax=Demequina salsinemoris TaxID=577470 RepID=UPI000780FD76|nr:NYN domain-containing protein [Demequina salsinemoris]